MLNESQKNALYSHFHAGKGYTEAARSVGVHASAARRFYDKLKQNGERPPEIQINIKPAEEAGLPFEDVLADENPRTLEDLIRVCEIDTTQWEIVSHEITKWEVGMGIERLADVEGKGFSKVKIKDRSKSVPLFRIQVKLKPRVKGAVTLREFTDTLAQAMADNQMLVAHEQHVPEYQERTALYRGEHLLEVDPFDVHFGKFCWAAETVTDYDLAIALKGFKWAVEDLIQKTKYFGIERILLPVGNDALHSDGIKGQTFSGTQLDNDGRFAKVFRRTHEAHSWAIRRLRQIAPVDVVVVPGNHDKTAAWHLGHVLQTEFRDDIGVTVDNSGKPRKYYAFGKNLLGFAHGDKEKQADLPLLMAREVPVLWAAAEHREWHIGHMHKYKELKWLSADSYAGTIVRTLNSISAHDLWHTEQGYTDRRAMQAFIHNRRTGFVGMFHANIFHDGTHAD